MNIQIQPKLLHWARERVGLDEAALAKKLGTKTERVIEWEKNGELSWKKAEKLSHVTHIPLYKYVSLYEKEQGEKIPDDIADSLKAYDSFLNKGLRKRKKDEHYSSFADLLQKHTDPEKIIECVALVDEGQLNEQELGGFLKTYIQDNPN